MKKMCFVLTIGSLLCWSTFASAISFNVNETYSSGRNNRNSYVSVNDKQKFGYSPMETLSLPVDSGELTSAFLDLTFSDVSTGGRRNSELWSVLVATSLDNDPSTFKEFVSLGQLLSAGRLNSRNTMSFQLDGALLADLLKTGKLYVMFKESTRGADSFKLVSSSLHGDYELPPIIPDPPPGPVNPVPEPSTMLLLGSGLCGLLGVRKKIRG